MSFDGRLNREMEQRADAIRWANKTGEPQCVLENGQVTPLENFEGQRMLVRVIFPQGWHYRPRTEQSWRWRGEDGDV